jgi:integrase
MLANIKYKGIKVRRHGSHLYQGEDKFTGTVRYSVVGSLNREEVRHSLGTEEKAVAVRRVAKLERAIAEGPTSPAWHELNESLPATAFKFFADRCGVSITGHKATSQTTWGDLCGAYELEMERTVANKLRGAGREEGIMSPNTRSRYRQCIVHFSKFLADVNTPLTRIEPSTIEKYKVERHKDIIKLKQSRGGSSIALDVAILHRIFNFALSKQMMQGKNPIDLSKESKPGKNPRNPARPFNAEELALIREAAGEDKFTFLFWTGLRGSDALNLRWENVHFNRGANGEVEIMTQKRTKLAIIPLSTELREALQEVHQARKPPKDDRVLYNPETGEAFTSRKRLYERAKALGIRAGVKRVTPHCFRDTFACDMLARGEDIYGVAKMLADTVETVEKHYAQFVLAARDAAQHRMDNGLGIEERGKIAQQRGGKVLSFR